MDCASLPLVWSIHDLAPYMKFTGTEASSASEEEDLTHMMQHTLMDILHATIGVNLNEFNLIQFEVYFLSQKK